MNEKLKNYLENSFLKELLNKDSITDISYNGEDIYYQDNYLGRQKFDKKISYREAYEFVRQIANLTDSQFSYSKPILDVSVDKYRFNATHYALARKNREATINFSIRIGFLSLRIKDDESFIPSKCVKLLKRLIENKQSIIIGGQTSSGKTELQKFLLSLLSKNTRIIILDNVEELETDDFLKDIDSQTWLLKDNIGISFEELIKNALRNNPDWLIVSEARGKEMMSILNSAMTGHPTISTLHAKDSSYLYRRMGRMCLLQNDNLRFKDVIEDIYDHFKIVVYVKKEFDKYGNIYRYVEKIGSNYLNRYYDIYSYPNSFYPLKEDFRIHLNMKEDEFIEFNKSWANIEIINEEEITINNETKIREISDNNGENYEKESKNKDEQEDYNLSSC